MYETSKYRSQFEKFTAGLEAIKQYQPAAPLKAVKNYFLVGNAEDPNLPNGLLSYLGKLGFAQDENSGMFVFECDYSEPK